MKAVNGISMHLDLGKVSAGEGREGFNWTLMTTLMSRRKQCSGLVHFTMRFGMDVAEDVTILRFHFRMLHISALFASGFSLLQNTGFAPPSKVLIMKGY